MRLARWSASILLALGLVAQAEAGTLIMTGDFDSASEGPHNDYEAARFLTQATFGPTPSEIARLRQMGYNAWLNEQFGTANSGHRSYLNQIATDPDIDIYHNIRREGWMQRAIFGPDQLRQRMAFALSEILVTSDKAGSLGGEPFALAHYYDILANQSFGNYREVLEQVTLSPVMGYYLSMFRNRKPDAANNIRPDENYAREIMQLFSIGLVQLNVDGTPVMVSGQTVPTYNQETIRGFAHVFTGFAWNNCPVRDFDWCSPGSTGDQWFLEMSAPQGNGWDNLPLTYHAYEGNKQLLNYPGVSLPNGVMAAQPTYPGNTQTPRQNLETALDNIFLHPNVGPFISKLLIQRFVSSNPSPAYVGRVAAVFNNNGSGVRGDLRAVVRAILMDPEARTVPTDASGRGKLREPIIRVTQLWRALGATNRTNRIQDWYIHWPGNSIPQYALGANTVFNFFLPDYIPPGEAAASNLHAPEFQIQTDNNVVAFSNVLDGLSRWQYTGNTSEWLDRDLMLNNLDSLRNLRTNPDALLERLDVLFMAGQMSPHMRTVLKNYILTFGAEEEGGYKRVTEAIWMIVMSPEYVIEK